MSHGSVDAWAAVPLGQGWFYNWYSDRVWHPESGMLSCILDESVKSSLPKEALSRLDLFLAEASKPRPVLFSVEADQHVKQRMTELLGHRVKSLRTNARDHGYFLGVGVRLANGYRHAVAMPPCANDLNNTEWEAGVYAELSAWIDAHEALPPLS